MRSRKIKKVLMSLKKRQTIKSLKRMKDPEKRLQKRRNPGLRRRTLHLLKNAGRMLQENLFLQKRLT